MMLCYQAETMIQEYLEGSLNASERLRLAEHLLDCPGCRRTLDEMQRLHALAARQPMLVPDEHLTERVMAQIRLRPQPVRSPGRSPLALGYGLLILILGYAAWVGWNRFVWARLPWAGFRELWVRSWDSLQTWWSQGVLSRGTWLSVVLSLTLLVAGFLVLIWDRWGYSKHSRG